MTQLSSVPATQPLAGLYQGAHSESPGPHESQNIQRREEDTLSVLSGAAI